MGIFVDNKVHLTIGTFSQTLDLLFLGALVFGAFVVALFSREKFNEPTYPSSDDDWATKLQPRHLAPRQLYRRAILFYVAALEAAYVSMVILGPRVIGVSADIANTGASTPIAIALLLTGILPNAPWIKQVELSLRRLGHERAFIPDGAREIADRLAAGGFDFSSYEEDVKASRIAAVSTDDFTSPQVSVEHLWARLSCVTWAMTQSTGFQAKQYFDSQFLTAYKPHIERLKTERGKLTGRVTAHKETVRARMISSDVSLQDDITALLDRLHIFVGCAVRLKQKSDREVEAALNAIGFRPKTIPETPTDMDVVLKVLPGMAVLVFAIVFVAQYIFASLKPVPEWVPKNPIDAVRWALSTLLVQAAAVISAAYIRRRWIMRGRWPRPGTPDFERPGDKYFLAAVFGACAGFAVLLCWTALMGPLTWSHVKSTAAWALLPGVTAFFVAVHFDTIEESGRRRLFEMSSQGLATGIVAFVAARIWLFTRAPQAHAAAVNLFSVFVGSVGVLVGATLGFYLPHKHRRIRKQPRDPYLLERLERLTNESKSIFKDEVAASRWLNTALPELDGLTPMASAYTSLGAARARQCLTRVQQSAS